MSAKMQLAPGDSHVGRVGTPGELIPVTLTLDTSAYASGDVIADTQPIPNAMRFPGGTGTLISITIIDKDDQGAAFTVFILDQPWSLGAENGAPSIADLQAEAILGWVDFATTDYKDVTASKIGCVKGIGLEVKAAPNSRDLYVAVMNSTGTPTYSANGMIFKFGFLQD